LKNTKVLRDIESGQIVHFEDVELAETKALEIYHTMAKEV
jgi:predicted homoserine dehydrogenase-like protein